MEELVTDYTGLREACETVFGSRGTRSKACEEAVHRKRGLRKCFEHGFVFGHERHGQLLRERDELGITGR